MSNEFSPQSVTQMLQGNTIKNYTILFPQNFPFCFPQNRNKIVS